MNSQPMTYRYRGNSMSPCFQEGDLLEVVPAHSGTIRVGDCVVLECEDGNRVVHRVVGLARGLRTRGDALRHEDRFGSSPPELIGRVTARYRMGNRSTVAGAWAGILAGLFYRYAGRIDPARPGKGGQVGRKLRTFCVPILRPLRCRGASRILLLPGSAEFVVWGFGRCVLARKRGAEGEWEVRWPWRIIFHGPERL